MLLFLIVIISQCYIQQSDGKASVVGCVSAKQAESIFEEISKLFDNAPLLDAIESLISGTVSEVSIDAIDYCNGPNAGFKEKYMEQVELLQARAAMAENDIKEANENRVKQVEVARVFEDTWKKMQKIYRTHDKTLLALDMFFKDSIMQTSAKIGHQIRSGNNGETEWNSRTIVKALGNDAVTVLSVMEVMPSSMSTVMESVLIEMLWINIASQAYSAINKSPLQHIFQLQYKIYSRYERFSELSISADIRRQSRLRFDTMVVGIDEAEEYATKTNATLDLLREVIDKINKASRYISCDENKRIGAAGIQDLGQLAGDLESNEVQFAADYLAKINDYYRDTFKPYLSSMELDRAMSVIKDTLPQTRNPLLEETHNFISNFDQLGWINGMGSLYKHWFLFLNETVKRMDIMVRYSSCHARILKLMGDIIQGCSDGRGTFDEIYERVTSGSHIDSQNCTDASMLQVPTKDELKQTVRRVATALAFNADCKQNEQQDGMPSSLDLYDNDDDDDDDDDDARDRLSPTQRLMVCDLRSKSRSENDIATTIKMPVESVSEVRCKKKTQANDMHGKMHRSKRVLAFLKTI